MANLSIEYSREDQEKSKLPNSLQWCSVRTTIRVSHLTLHHQLSMSKYSQYRRYSLGRTRQSGRSTRRSGKLPSLLHLSLSFLVAFFFYTLYRTTFRFRLLPPLHQFQPICVPTRWIPQPRSLSLGSKRLSSRLLPPRSSDSRLKWISPTFTTSSFSYPRSPSRYLHHS